MVRFDFDKALRRKVGQQAKVVARRNRRSKDGDGIVDRWQRPVLSAVHVPLFWRYDLDRRRNPYLQERLGVNGVTNAGAVERGGRIYLVARVEGRDGESFFAVAESPNGVDEFRFWDRPPSIPEAEQPDTGVSDMRLTSHEDGWIYGVFRTERLGAVTSPGDASAAVARAGIARTKDLIRWERLPDLVSPSLHQRDVVLHPELVGGRYALYTGVPVTAGKGGGIGLALCETMEGAEIVAETIIDTRADGVGRALESGAGAPPLKTPEGWLHIAHGVRPTRAGPRHVLHAFLCELGDPSKVVANPGGSLLAVGDAERTDETGDVLCYGAVARAGGEVVIYYSRSDARTYVATSTINRLLDHVLGTPRGSLHSGECVEQRNTLISRNLRLLARTKRKVYKGLR